MKGSEIVKIIDSLNLHEYRIRFVHDKELRSNCQKPFNKYVISKIIDRGYSDLIAVFEIKESD